MQHKVLKFSNYFEKIYYVIDILVVVIVKKIKKRLIQNKIIKKNRF
jgi:hypothetical protein